jgi:carbon monoxide dehydrogenase subunit G
MDFTVERRVRAEPAKVWSALSDFARSPGGGVEVRVVEAGADDGKNMVRDLRIGLMRVRERIDEVVSGESFTYSILKGAPTRTYRGKGRIAPGDGETIITWSGDFVPLVPGSGLLVRLLARRSVKRYLDAVLAKVG